MTRLLVLGLVCVAATAGSAGSATPPPLSSTCGDAPGIVAQPSFVRTADGVDLYALDAGTGSTAVVLVHESPANLCGWLPYIPTLIAAGFRVLAFDLRGFGHSAVPPNVPYRAYDRDPRRWSHGRTRTARSRSSCSVPRTAAPSP
jgi:hypothetical protein